MTQSTPTPTAQTFPANRQEGLRRLEQFLPRSGRDYQNNRNTDEGPGTRQHVSMLSPYLRRRLLSEAEVVQATVSKHGAVSAEKFIQEVLWRTYWKGWLEMRPQVWTSYLQDRERLFQEEADQSREYLKAINGQTGIDCMDSWAEELTETGYLHNHARMWFASIWIFTLKLPWQLGADFFYRHLLDGDPASNTLGWRWVAGIQTPGKHYVARASNIARYTDNRFRPFGQLNEDPKPVEDLNRPERRELPEFALPASGPLTGLLMFDDDCLMEKSEIGGHTLHAIAGVSSDKVIKELHLSEKVTRFASTALKDGLTRASQHFGAPADFLQDATPDSLAVGTVTWATRQSLQRVLICRPPIGPNAPLARALKSALEEAGIETAWVQRRWDADLCPHATRGFFVFKKVIPQMLGRLPEYH